MARLNFIVAGILILQIYVNAAPSDVSKIDDTAKIEEGPKLDSKDDGKNDTQSIRQKRYYNYFGYGFPPVNPGVYPSYTKRDESQETGNYGNEDPFAQIHRRLQEIANVVRQPVTPPPQPSQVPIFFPVLYIPQTNCRCDPNTSHAPNPTDSTNRTNPEINTRLPDLNVMNETDVDGEDYSRPISFDPVTANVSLSRPPPPVDHGSSQSGTSDGASTTFNPNFGSSFAATASPESADIPPSSCDGAVLSCCHQAEVTYDCFALQGCPDPSYGNPCDIGVILRVIDRFQRFYGQKNGV